MNNQILDKLNDFFGAYNLKNYSAGQIISLAQQEPPGIIFLTKGLVGQCGIDDKGQKVVLNIFKPPVFFPMSWAINKNTSQFLYEALNDVECRVAPPEEVLNFTKANPDVLLDLLARVYRGTDGLLNKIFELSVGSAKSRLYQEIVVEAIRFGQLKPNGSAVISITAVELSERAGLSRETVSRQLKELQTEGLISRQNSQITVNKIP